MMNATLATNFGKAAGTVCFLLLLWPLHSWYPLRADLSLGQEVSRFLLLYLDLLVSMLVAEHVRRVLLHGFRSGG
jgi:hypothetical protein